MRGDQKEYEGFVLGMINLLPLSEGENITTIMPLPENEREWENLYIMFTTEKGNVRKNKQNNCSNVTKKWN